MCIPVDWHSLLTNNSQAWISDCCRCQSWCKSYNGVRLFYQSYVSEEIITKVIKYKRSSNTVIMQTLRNQNLGLKVHGLRMITNKPVLITRQNEISRVTYK